MRYEYQRLALKERVDWPSLGRETLHPLDGGNMHSLLIASPRAFVIALSGLPGVSGHR